MTLRWFAALAVFAGLMLAGCVSRPPDYTAYQFDLICRFPPLKPWASMTPLEQNQQLDRSSFSFDLLPGRWCQKGCTRSGELHRSQTDPKILILKDTPPNGAVSYRWFDQRTYLMWGPVEDPSGIGRTEGLSGVYCSLMGFSGGPHWEEVVSVSARR